MERDNVQSAAIKSVGYNTATKTLEIEFRDGGAVWQYHDLSTYLYKRFRKAESLGNFFVTRIKGKFRESRIG